MSGKTELNDLKLLVQSSIPIINIETHEEKRAIDLLSNIAFSFNKPLMSWDVVDGLSRVDVNQPLHALEDTQTPEDVLRHIKTARRPSIYVLCDFHPYLQEAPQIIRLIKEISLDTTNGHTLVFISHELSLPAEISRFASQFSMALPNKEQLEQLIRSEAKIWSRKHNKRVRTDSNTLARLISNLQGLTYADARQLIQNIISDDGAITEDELPAVNKAKFELLNMDGVLSFEYETAKFAEVGGLKNLKQWLKQREAIFHRREEFELDPPKGLMLVGVQGGGKSLAAKAVAGMWGVALLRLDFGSLYNKYHGETEKNLREALTMAELMAPCVLWFDEIEKGISTESNDGGTSQRVLGTLLTWMAENDKPVFVVSTANDISKLPPELMRKGRLDEIFFVDLPDTDARMEIFKIHLEKRKMSASDFSLPALAQKTDGFTGSEIEQIVVSGLYSSYGQKVTLSDSILLQEIDKTRPLSVVMAEQFAQLKQWAQGRTVIAN
ncbi:AAA family ATPase [Pleionea sp. CnH1-48]|uniref:AAA family ATPase n=1 Tax=Pleionea sp. CnH1-48 TaxID=2954494 RepID=UPI002096A01F|nr:AAA family ATPase [Pleionea sp. CnH1-48]MCO7224681.1 AAA family ATPase [Pleionea sp. CnH1-48]